MARIINGCLICQSKLVYNPAQAMDVTCLCCGKKDKSYVICPNGHYICDECHRKNILQVVEKVCLASDLNDPLDLALRIFNLPALHMHGPEYHSIVPAVLITAYANWCQVDKAPLIREAIERGKQVRGGFCGSHGICGAAAGVGIAFALINKVTPCSVQERGLANKMTALALLQISQYGGPRCCKRESILAIEVAKKEFACFGEDSDIKYICSQYVDNEECIEMACPYHPTNAK